MDQVALAPSLLQSISISMLAGRRTWDIVFRIRISYFVFYFSINVPLQLPRIDLHIIFHLYISTQRYRV